MNQNTGTPNIPEVVRFIPRILATLREMNGVAKAGAVKAAVVQAIFEAGEPVNDQMLSSGVPKYQNDIYWARMYLVNAGLLEPSKVAGHGVWKLTQGGWQSPLDMSTAAAIYYMTLPLFRVALNPRFTRPFYAVPRTSAARTASG